MPHYGHRPHHGRAPRDRRAWARNPAATNSRRSSSTRSSASRASTRRATGRERSRRSSRASCRPIRRWPRAAATSTCGTWCAGRASATTTTRSAARCSRTSCSASTMRSDASSTISAPPRPAPRSAAACCCCSGPPSGGKSTLVILLKRGLEEYSYTDDGALYAVQGCPVNESPLHLVPHTLRSQFRETYGVDIIGELCPSCRLRVEQRVRRRLHEDAGAAHLHLRSRPHRHRHLRAARSDDRGPRRPRRLGRPVEGRRVRRRRRSARVVVVRRGVRGEPRHARDDRDPEGEARVPLPAADADAGEERQGVALPADPRRRDDRRAHQPRGVPQVPAGARERGAARPDGDHPGAVHARLPRRGEDLPEADQLGRAGVPRSASRSARAAHGRGVRDPHAPARRRGQGRRLRQARPRCRRARRSTA